MRTGLTATLRAALNAPGTGEGLILLITLTHAGWATVRYTNNTRDVVSRGNTYTALKLSGRLPPELDGPVEVPLMLDSTDPAFSKDVAVAPLEDGTATMEAVKLSDYNTVEASAVFKIRHAHYNDDTAILQLTLAYEPLLDSPWPGLTFNPVRSPDLFR